MKKTNPLLILWLLFSAATVSVGVGFAGGVEGIFVVPQETGPSSILIWLTCWIIVVFPVAFYIVCFVRKK